VDPGALSKALFGNKHMLAVLTYIAAAPSGVVTQREIAQKTELPDSTVSLVIKRLVAAQALVALPKTGTAQFLERLSSPVWPMTALVERWLEDPTASASRPAKSRPRDRR
jgi:hypothetical protein